MKTLAAIATVSLLVCACSGDDTVVPDAGDAGGDTTTNDVTQDTTQQDTTTSDAPGDTSTSDSPSDAPSDTGLDALPDVVNHCTDGQMDVDETDTDCGGLTCPKCGTGKKCLVNTDCVSGNCKNNKTCQ
jgi:hypothetical protein